MAGMIRLTLLSTPYWIDLTDGVRVLVRPLDTRLYEAARAAAAVASKDAITAIDAVRDAGGDVTGLDLRDTADLVGLSQFVFVKALASRSIDRWEGVGDDDGAPVPASPENIERLMAFHDMAERFAAEYTRPYADRRVEGKDSGTSPDGVSVQVPTTATVAGTAAPAAPTANEA